MTAPNTDTNVIKVTGNDYMPLPGLLETFDDPASIQIQIPHADPRKPDIIIPGTAPEFTNLHRAQKVTALSSGNRPGRCLHLNPACAGLERVPANLLRGTVHRSLYMLFTVPDMRPCRLCALLPAATYLLNRPRRGPRQLVTFSGQAPATRSTVTEISDSARERMSALINASDRLHGLSTAAGPVAVGELTRTEIQILATQFRVIEIPSNMTVTLDTIEVMWSFATTDQWAPEHGHDPELGSVWEIAAATIS